MSVYLKAPGNLAEEDRQILRRLARNFNLLADLSYADVLLLCRDGDEAVVVAEARPEPIPSLYAESQLGTRLTRGRAAQLFKVLFDGHGHSFGSMIVRGVPTIQEIFAIRNPQGQTIAAVLSQMALLEHERLRKRSALFRRAIARARDQILDGRLEGGEKLGRLSMQDGVLVVDGRGQIQYISSVAEHFYRRLGYADTLVKAQLSDLETSENICFRAMERQTCLEQRVREQELTCIRRVIPLLSTSRRGLFGRLSSNGEGANGAIVMISDITDEIRKEQELKIKSAMIHEIHHRVKNNLQTIAGLLRMQARRSESPEVSEQLEQTVNRILSIAVVHEFLSKDEQSIINIHEVCNRILDEVKHGTLDPGKRIELLLEGSQQFSLPAQQATSCALIINELLQNAVEHGYRDRGDGTIRVRLESNADSMLVEVQDDGAGLPEGFDLARSGLGLRIIQTLVSEDLKGHFTLENGQGTRARVSFPRSRLESAEVVPELTSSGSR
jgi:two-component system, sensor histidine kinase PdtaS